MITDWGQVLIGIAGTLVIQFLFCILILWVGNHRQHPRGRKK
jgi:hypothetical protein